MFFLCSAFGLHHLYGYHHEGRRRLGNKNNKLFCISLGLHYLYGYHHEGRRRLGNKNNKLFCISLGLHYLCKKKRKDGFSQSKSN